MLASARYQHLVVQLGMRLGHRRGWKAEVAADLDVTPGYISKVLGGTANAVSRATLAKAVRRLQLNPRYFVDADLGDVPFELFQSGASAETLGDVDLEGWAVVEEEATESLAWLSPPLSEAMLDIDGFREVTAHEVAIELLKTEPIATAIRVALHGDNRGDVAFVRSVGALAASVRAGHAALSSRPRIPTRESTKKRTERKTT